MDPKPPRALKRLISALTGIVDRCTALEQKLAADLAAIPPEQNASAVNLVHYLALRQYDVRELQFLLSSYGLSSLGRTESHTMASVLSVLHALRRLAGEKDLPQPASVPVNFSTGPALLERNTHRLLGGVSRNRPVRIMVTMPTEAAADSQLVRNLVEAGMDVMRINCAHDGSEAWLGMIANLRLAEQELGRRCKILMDLGGPKLRTGRLPGGAKVLKWRPERNARGLLLAPARLWLTSAAKPQPAASRAAAVIPVNRTVSPAMREGDTIEFIDTRKRPRVLKVTSVDKAGIWVECEQSAIVESGMILIVKRGIRKLAEWSVGELPHVDDPLRLQIGNTLVVTAPGIRRPRGMRDAKLVPMTLPEVLRDIRPKQCILFDDGKVGGVVKRCTKNWLEVEITQAGPAGGKLGSDKGINLPDTDIHLPALTEQDLRDLDFAVAHADLVGFSFVRKPADVERLQQELERRSASSVGIVLKIENRIAFEHLPKLLLEGLHTTPLGVMVARGDLAVEMGFDRLAEVQEEILWLCEAAHVPVIWATQVLESMAKTGTPSRAEVTDAAMSGRAECVMLNKGPHIIEVVKFLDDVLVRMKRHQNKKVAMLRRLSVSDVR